jgi:hypothetical protein
MIDPSCECLISLGNVPKLCPGRRGGKRPHVSCIYRWTTTGCRGVVLESIQVGGTRCTSREALARFFPRLTEDAGTPGGARRRTPARRRKAAERALRELAREGV